MKTFSSSERGRRRHSNDAICFKKCVFFLSVKYRFKRVNFQAFWNRFLICINRRCSTFNQPTIIIFAVIKSLFIVLSNCIKIVKKYEFLVQNRNKIPKFQFFVIFVRIDEIIRLIFSILQTSTTRIKIHVIRKKN